MEDTRRAAAGENCSGRSASLCSLPELPNCALILEEESSGFAIKWPTANGDLPVIKRCAKQYIELYFVICTGDKYSNCGWAIVNFGVVMYYYNACYPVNPLLEAAQEELILPGCMA